MKRTTIKTWIPRLAVSFTIFSLFLIPTLVRADTTTVPTDGGGTRTITTDDKGRVTDVTEKDKDGNTTYHREETYNPDGSKASDKSEYFDPKTGRRIVFIHKFDEKGRPISGEWGVYDGGKQTAGGKWTNTYKDDKDKKGKTSGQQQWNPKKERWENVALSSISLSEMSGMVVADVPTKNGTIRVHLPDDMMAGDTISGTVIAEPAGKTPQERAKNADELNGYVVQIEGQKSHAGQSWMTWAIPTAAAGAISLAVFDKQGHEVAHQAIPLQPSLPGGNSPATPPQPGAYHLPEIGQAGKPITITGPFDGNSQNTSVKIGGQDCTILTESPRQMSAQSPRDIVGQTHIQVEEKGVQAQGEYRNIAFGLTASKTSLQPGETTALTVMAQGLENLRTPVSVQLQNKTPEVISLTGGNLQTLEFTPSMVNGEGIGVKTLTLTGMQTGGFSIAANLRP